MGIKLSIDLIIDKIVQAVAMNQKVEIRGFGTFSKKYVRPRKFVNPNTKRFHSLVRPKLSILNPQKVDKDFMNKKLIVALDFDSAELALNFIENLDPQSA